MKSKTFSSDFRKCEFRKQIWIMLLFAGALFLAMPVRWMMELDNLTYHSQLRLSELQQLFLERAVCADTVWLVVSVAAILCAFYHFSWLHSSRQTDFYGSLPLRREQMFRYRVTSGYLDFAVPFTLICLMLILMGMSRHLLTRETLLGLFLAWLFLQIYYMLVYLVTALGMILTGKKAVGLVGSVLLLAFGYFVKAIIESYTSSFFDTHVYHSRDGIALLSPFYYGTVLKKLVSTCCWKAGSLGWREFLLPPAGAAAAVGLFFLGSFLIRRRNAEAAGKSVAFSVPARVLHILMSVFGALWVGLIVMNFLYNRRVLLILLSVFAGAIFFYLLLQFVYTLDVRRSLQYKWQLLVLEVLAMGTACIFCFDLFGYDTYLPDRQKTDNISISICSYLSDGGYSIDGEYETLEEYRLSHMKSGQQDELYRMAEQLIADQENIKNQDRSCDYLQVRYTLNSGRTVDRQYRINYPEYRREFARLFDDESFRSVTCPYLGDLADTEARVWVSYAGESREILEKDGVSPKDFLRIYREEMRSLHGSVFVDEIPLASVDIVTGKENNSFHMYLYPSCTETLACLEKMGCKIEPLLRADRIREITVEDYRYMVTDEDVEMVTSSSAVYYKAREEERTFTDPEDITVILPFLVDCDYVDVWHETQENLYAQVTVESPEGYCVTRMCQFLQGELPEILEARN